MTDEQLIKMALKARENSYSPYSNYKVGAALLVKRADGSEKVYLGTNIENCAYGPSNCAERSAMFSAISNGEKQFDTLAIVGSSEGVVYPCGVCRQVIVELMPNVRILCCKDENLYEVHTIQDLLPYAFTPKELE